MTHDLTGLVLHRHHTGRVNNARATCKVGAFGQQGIKLRLIAVQKKCHIRMGIGRQKETGDHGRWALIAAHAIQ